MAFEKYKQNWNELLKIAWPLIIANGFWNIQLTIDRIFLGNYSTEALGAAISVMGIFWVPMALIQQTSAYSLTFVAQFFGAGEESKIGPAVWQSIYISVIGGLLFLLLIPLSDACFALIDHSEKMQQLETDYFKALAFSALPTAIVAGISGFYSGLGISRMVMWINAVGLIFNVIFDYLLIFGNLGFSAYGIAGAGYATALANVAAAIFALWVVTRRQNEVKYKIRSGWKWQTPLMKRFLKFGVPSGLQWALEGLAFTIFLVIVGRMPNGDAALAASGISVTIMMLSILPTMGLSQGVSVLVGQYLGAKNTAAAIRSTYTGVQIAFCYMVALGSTFALFPEFYLSWFHNNDNPEIWQAVEIMVPRLLLFVALFTLFDSMNFVFSFALKGAGDTKFVTIMTLTLPWPLMVAPTWFFKDYVGAIYYSWAAASVYIIVLALVYWRRFEGGKWKNMSVIADVTEDG